MNLIKISSGVLCGLALGLANAPATIYTATGLPLTIPDGSPVGITSVITVDGGENLSAAGVSVILNVSGGQNGDLYAYLFFNGTTVVLLNRPGLAADSPLGYADAGFNNVTLCDGNNVNVDSYGGGGVPASAAFNPSAGRTAFAGFTGPANGDWTLAIFDLSGGDKSASALTGWSLDLEPVPEPVNVALGIFGGLAGLAALARAGAGRRRAG